MSRELGVEEPSLPESSTTVSESESLPTSEMSCIAERGPGIGARKEARFGEGEGCRGEFKGERMR